jgi:hypothetical protein
MRHPNGVHGKNNGGSSIAMALVVVVLLLVVSDDKHGVQGLDTDIGADDDEIVVEAVIGVMLNVMK